VTSDGVFRDISMEDDVRMAERISAALRRNSESPTQLFGFHELAGRGHRLSMKPPETIYDRNYFRIDVTYKDGLTVEHFIARSDALVELIREHVETDPGARRVETRLTDYRAVAGVLFPFLRTDADIDTLETLGTIRVESLRVNTREALGICEADHTLP